MSYYFMRNCWKYNKEKERRDQIFSTSFLLNFIWAQADFEGEKFKVISPWRSLPLGFSLKHPDWPLFFVFIPWTEPYLFSFLPFNFERIDSDPEKLRKFWLVHTCLVLKFPEEMWYYLWLSAFLSCQKGWSSTRWKYFDCEVSIQLGLQTIDSRSERSFPFLAASLK